MPGSDGALGAIEDYSEIPERRVPDPALRVSPILEPGCGRPARARRRSRRRSGVALTCPMIRCAWIWAHPLGTSARCRNPCLGWPVHDLQRVRGRPPSSTALAARSAGSTSWRAAAQLGLCRASLADRQTVYKSCPWEGCLPRDLARVRCQPGPHLNHQPRIIPPRPACSVQTVMLTASPPPLRAGIDSSRTRQTMTSSGTHWSSLRSSGCASRLCSLHTRQL